jgi:hypothetical protein
VKSWFQAFAFKWVNLCRYGLEKNELNTMLTTIGDTLTREVRGLFLLLTLS